MAFDLGAITAKLELDDSKFTVAVKTAEKEVQTFSGSILKNEKQIKDLGRTFTIAGAAITAGFVMAAKANGEFNKGMAEVATLIPNSIGRVKDLKQSVEDMAIATGKSTKDLTRGLYEVISAYGDTSDTVKILEINAKAAAAGMATTLDAIRLTSAVTKGYGETSATATQKVADLAFLTVKLGQTTFPELANSIGAAVPLAKSLNVGVEELFASMATLTGVTGNANEVTTQMQAAMRGFMRPTEGMKDALKQLKVGTVEQLIAQEGLIGSLRKVIGTTDGTIDSIGKLFMRAEGLGAVLALTGGQAEVFDKKFIEMQKATGTAGEALKEVTDGINKNGFTAEQAAQKMAAAIRKFGEIAEPIITKIQVLFAGLLENITKFADTHPIVFKAISIIVGALGALMAIIGPILLVLPTLAKSFSILGGAVSKIGPAFVHAGAGLKTFMLSTGPFIAAAGLLIAVGVKIIKTIDGIKEAYDNAIRAEYEHAELQKKSIDRFRDFAAAAGVKGEEIRKLSLKYKDVEDAGRKHELMLRELKKTYPEVTKTIQNQNKAIEISAELVSTLTSANEEARDAIMKATKTEYEYTIWSIKDKYDKQITSLKDLGAREQDLITLRKARQAELTAAIKAENEKQAEVQKKKAEEVTKKEKEETDKRKKLAEDLADAVSNAQKDATNTIMKLTKKEADYNEWAIKEKYKDLKAALTKMGAEEKDFALLDKAMSLELAKNSETAAKKKESAFSKAMSKINGYLQIMQQGFGQFFNAITQLSDNRYKREFQQIDAEYEKQKEAIENSLMSEEEKSLKMEELDAAYAEKKRALEIKQAEANKKSGIAQAIVNTALAVVSALATKPFFPMGLIAAAMAAAAGAIQIAVIKSTPVPGMARGGLVTQPTEVIVGEKDPEGIIPLPDLKKMVGVDKERRKRQTPQFNISIQAFDSRDVERVTNARIIPIIKKALNRESLRIPARSVG